MNDLHTLPQISVVVPAYYPGMTLEQTLTSILNLEYPKGLMEVLVVSVPDDSMTHDIVRQIASKADLDMRDLIVNSSMLTVRINYGIQNSKYGIVLMVNDDVRVHKQTLIRGVEIMMRNKKTAAVEFTVVQDGTSLVERLYYMRFVKARAHSIFTVTACTIFNKAILKEVGLYREDMGPPRTIHEDWELGSRIRKKGFKVIIDGSIHSEHLGHYSLRAQAHSITDRGSGPKNGIADEFIKGARRNYKTFFIVMGSSPFRQRLEYSLYFGLPLAILILLFFSISYSVSLTVTAIFIAEINSFSLGHYRVFNMQQRIVYPLVVVFLRIARIYLSFFFLLADVINSRLR